jgi:hypothetical protein
MARVRTLTADPEGLASMLERESQTMHPLQFYREAVQNEIEAGAIKIIIDGFKSPNGLLLARVSGNGKGMTGDKLVSHLSTVMKTDKGKGNYGLGARIAALPRNPAGVTFASKTASGTGMISIIKQGRVYGLRSWPVQTTDEDGELVTLQEEVIAPSHGMLARIGQTGTAVILHGDGRSATWDGSLVYRTHNYLAKRYYKFPNNVSVTVARVDNRKFPVVPFGKSLNDWAIADGLVLFSDVAGLSGTMFWWLLPTFDELQRRISGEDRFSGGIGLVVDDEIFDYGQSHMTDFGVQYKSVMSRIVILVAVDGAKMDTSRSAVVYPLGKRTDKKTTPWKEFGRYFSEHMPPELDAIMSRVLPSKAIFTEDAAKKLDHDWMKWIKPVPVSVPKRDGSPAVGDESGDALPPGETHERVDPPPPPPPPPHPPELAAHRQNSGQKPGVTKLKIVTPQVKFIPADEMPDGRQHIYWAETGNVIMISEAFPPFVREVKRWLEKTDYPKSFVEAAVKQAYSIEYAAYIIDANAQRAARLIPENIEILKSDLALYGKALGCQSLTEMIERYLKTVVRTA